MSIADPPVRQRFSLTEERAMQEPSPMTNGVPLPGTLSIVGYDLPGNLDFDRWRSIGSTLQSIHRAINWWVGDWLLYGERHFGDEAYQAVRDQITEILGRSDESIRQAIWVAQQFPPDQRRRDLRWSHHREVLIAKLPRDERYALLDVAVTEKLSTRDLGDLARRRADDLAHDPAPQLGAATVTRVTVAAPRDGAPGDGTLGGIPDGLYTDDAGQGANTPLALPQRPVLIALPPPSDEAAALEIDEEVTVKRSEVIRVMQELESLRVLARDGAEYIGPLLTRKRGEVFHLLGCRIGQYADGYGAPWGAPCSVRCVDARAYMDRVALALEGWQAAS